MAVAQLSTHVEKKEVKERKLKKKCLLTSSLVTCLKIHWSVPKEKDTRWMFIIKSCCVWLSISACQQCIIIICQLSITICVVSFKVETNVNLVPTLCSPFLIFFFKSNFSVNGLCLMHIVVYLNSTIMLHRSAIQLIVDVLSISAFYRSKSACV